ncbi:hypothetical protein SAMN05428988_0103 [Chitinophaga sp. YR573]|uniref:hypothetical protein n=1 Tax=Chitinophaga sp. YR573 TaxID=1881040 RepID=UPI0008D4AC55|nr:hypothetical protein [Chitinophaga sp. YR573]SEV88410.1 hypothetical protein SAMN05428988_0103 [Chitinophaga sp. YR573]
MKNLLIPLFLFYSFMSYAQSFFVSGKDTRSNEHVEQKIKFEGYKIAVDSLKSDYTVQLLIDGEYNVVSFKRSYQGYIRIINSNTGLEVGRTKIIKRNPAVFNGYNASYDIFSIISKRYLAQELKKCITIHS